MAVLRDLDKEFKATISDNMLSTYIIGAVHRSLTMDHVEDIKDAKWRNTQDVYALVTAKSAVDALKQYLASRPDLAEKSLRWSFDDKSQRVWAVQRYTASFGPLRDSHTYEGIIYDVVVRSGHQVSYVR